MRIKKLYSELIDNWDNYHDPKRDFSVPDWYQRYSAFYSKVDSVRSDLNSGGKLDAQKDEIFLRKLILAEKNDIANAGNSRLAKEVFYHLIEDNIFLGALSELIKNPNIDQFENFGETWRSQGLAGKFKLTRISRPLRINRVAAVCTDKVSSTVDRECFIEAFKILNSLLPTPYKSPTLKVNKMGEREWFQENLYLMSELRKIFPAEKPILLSIFVWEIYHHRDNLPA